MTDIVEAKRPAPIVEFKRQLDKVAEELPSSPDFPIDKMKSVAVVAVSKAPDLMHADRASLFNAIRECASAGLLPDGNEATLQVYNTKQGDEWIKKVQFMPMVRGILKRIRNSNKVKTIWAEVVREGEDFTLSFVGGERIINHEHNPMNRTGKIVGAYAVSALTNGATEIEVMNRDDLDRVRKSAKTQKVWEAWEAEKCKVAVLRRLSKRLPVASSDLNIIMGDEHDFTQRVREVVPEKKGGFAKMAIEARKEEAPIEGEVVPDDGGFPGGSGKRYSNWSMNFNNSCFRLRATSTSSPLERVRVPPLPLW